MTNKNNRIQMGGQPDYEDFHGVVADGATVTPGDLVEVTDLDADGTVTVQPHSTDGEAPTQPLFVDVLPYSGDPEDENAAVDDTIEAGNYVKLVGAKRYNRINARLAAGADLTTGTDASVDPYEGVTSAGDGTVRSAASGGTAFAHFREAEAVDNEGASAGETARVIIEVQ